MDMALVFDAVIGLIVAASLVLGAGHGFWRTSASTLALTTAFAVIAIFGPALGSMAEEYVASQFWADVLAYSGGFALAFLIARFLFGFLAGRFRRGSTNIVGRLGGFLIGGVRGLVAAAVVLFALNVFEAPGGWKDSHAARVAQEVVDVIAGIFISPMVAPPSAPIEDGPEAPIEGEPPVLGETPSVPNRGPASVDFEVLDTSDVELTQNDACNRAAAASASSTDPRRGYVCVPLLYGANREPDPAGGENPFGPRVASDTDVCIDDDVCNVRLGVATVTVPRRRRGAEGSPIKKLRSPTVVATDRDRNSKFTVWDIDSIADPRAFAAVARGYLDDAEIFEEQAFVFVHGFNMEFRDAAFRTAQIAFDLDFDGPAFFFSWPANGDVLDYLSDQDDADVSVNELAAFLKLVRRSVGPDTRVHLIAHSMGTRLTAQALARLDRDGYFDVYSGFDVMIFAAGDLDAQLFREWVGADVDRMADRVTLFASKRDVAVATSNVLRQLSTLWKDNSADPKERIGLAEEARGPSVFPHMTTIDLTAVGEPGILGFKDFNHDDYVGDPDLMADIACQFQGGPTNPSQRSPKFVPAVRADAAMYWRFEPETLGDSTCLVRSADD